MEASPPNEQPEPDEDPRVSRCDMSKPPMTVKAWRESGLIGSWKDRTDIGDSVEYARELRERVWKRSEQ